MQLNLLHRVLALCAPAGHDAASLMGRLRPRSPTKAALRAKAEAKQQAEANAELQQAGLLRQPRDGRAPHHSLSPEQSTLPVSTCKGFFQCL